MPDVDVLDKTNGHHEEHDVLSPVDDTLSPHPVSTSDGAGESTDEAALPAEHVEEEIKEEPPAEKGPSKTTSTKPPTTAAKKVVGAGKPALAKANTPGVKPSPTSPVKRANTATARTAMPPPKPPAPTHTRRTSVLPPKVQPAADRKSLSSSIGTKPTLSSSVLKTPASAINKPPSRASMVSSPDPDTVKPPLRPRASITEAVKRTPSISKPSVGVSKPSSSMAASRLSRTPGSGSISSLKEIKENGKPPSSKAGDDLQQKLDKANEALSVKETAIANLESQVSDTKSSLESALADTQEKQARLEELEQAKAAAEQQLEEVQAKLQVLQAERDADDSAALLESVKAELHGTKELLQSEKGSVEILNSRIALLEAGITSTKSELEALRASSQLSSSEAAAAAAIEHEALVKTRAELEATNAEASTLKATHAAALDELRLKLTAAEEKAQEVEKLELELDALKKERGETANRISELEIEVLEARDAVEEAEDAKTRAESKAKVLEDELLKAGLASESELKNKEKSLLAQLDEAKKGYEVHAAELQQEQHKLLSQLSTLEDELAAAQAGLEKASQEQQLAAEEHAVKLRSLEDSNQLTLDELNAELQRISNELESQEEILAARVEVVKEEHEQRLREAFGEANAKHGIDLQALRAESAASLEQLTQFHETTIKGLKAEHAAILEEQTGDLSKEISKLTLELKATQDDLAKSKAALDTSVRELKSLEAQLEAAHATAEILASSVTPDRTAEVNGLKKDLADANSDLSALQDVLAATNESIADMSNRHARELEDAMKARATEVAKLKSAHEFELAQLAKEESDLSSRLSDAQSEIATLRAIITARPSTPSATRAHGHGRTGSGTVTKEEIQKMHEAHNLKMGDLRADYEKKLKGFREDLEAANGKTKELESDLERKTMEIKYLEQEQEEANDTITRLQEDLETLMAGQE